MKSIKILIILLCIFSIKTYAQYENFDWFYMPEANYNSVAYEVETDKNDNIYVVGEFEGTLIIQNDTVLSPENEDMFIAKFDGEHKLLWLKQSKGNSILDGPIVMKIDNNGDFYVVGDYWGDELIFENDTLPSNNYYYMYIAKFNSNGELLWTKAPKYAWTQDITIDSLGNLYIAVLYNGYVIFEDDTIYSNSMYEGCVVKYSSSGDYQWVRQLGSPEHEFPNNYNNRISSITSDIENGIYFAAHFNVKATINDSIFTTENGGLLITKLTADNNIVWVKKYDIASLWKKKNNIRNLASDKLINNKEKEIYSPHIKADYNNNIFVLSDFSDTIIFNNDTLIPNNGYFNDLLLNFNKQGYEIKSNQLLGAMFPPAFECMSVDINSNLYLLAYGSDSSMLINDTVIYISKGPPVLKFNSENNFVAHIEIPALYYRSITTNTNGNAIIVGCDYFPGYDIDKLFIAQVKDFNTNVFSPVHNSNNNITIYPNPSNGIINFGNICDKPFTIYLYNLHGKLVYTININQNITEIVLPKYFKGIYVIKIQNKDSAFSQKIIII